MPALSSSLISSLSRAPALTVPETAGGLSLTLAGLPDPRARRGVRHRLTVVVVAAVCAVVAGCRSYTAIADRVLTLSPGPTRTEFYATSGSSDEGVQLQTPDEVVAAGLRALDAGHTPARVVSGARNRINVAVLRRLPRRTATALMAGSTTSA